jgi:hypothetical protein
MRKTLGLAFLLCLLSGFAYADGVPVDPDMVVNDPICPPTSPQPCAPIVTSGVLFTFNANGTGGGTTSFEINPGTPSAPAPAFTSLDIETADPNGCMPNGDCSNVQCSSDKFSCQVSLIGGITNVHFFIQCIDVCSSPGFVPGDVFTIDLDNPNTPGSGGWTPNVEFGGIGNLGTAPSTPFLTPEPSSALMLLTGAAALAARRKINKRSQ